MRKQMVAMPFFSCVAMVMGSKEQVTTIALNPFTHNVILPKGILEVADKRRNAPPLFPVSYYPVYFLPSFFSISIRLVGILEVADKRRNALQQTKAVRLTEKQFQDLVHNRVVMHLLPKYLFAHKEEDGMLRQMKLPHRMIDTVCQVLQCVQKRTVPGCFQAALSGTL